MFLIVYMTKVSRGVYKDHVEPIESRTLAEERFFSLMLDDSIYSLSLCGVLKSTNYAPAESINGKP